MQQGAGELMGSVWLSQAVLRRGGGGAGGILHACEPALALWVCDRCDTLKPHVVQCLGSFLVLTPEGIPDAHLRPSATRV